MEDQERDREREREREEEGALEKTGNEKVEDGQIEEKGIADSRELAEGKNQSGVEIELPPSKGDLIRELELYEAGPNLARAVRGDGSGSVMWMSEKEELESLALEMEDELGGMLGAALVRCPNLQVRCLAFPCMSLERQQVAFFDLAYKINTDETLVLSVHPPVVPRPPISTPIHAIPLARPACLHTPPPFSHLPHAPPRRFRSSIRNRRSTQPAHARPLRSAHLLVSRPRRTSSRNEGIGKRPCSRGKAAKTCLYGLQSARGGRWSPAPLVG